MKFIEYAVGEGKETRKYHHAGEAFTLVQHSKKTKTEKGQYGVFENMGTFPFQDIPQRWFDGKSAPW